MEAADCAVKLHHIKVEAILTWKTFLLSLTQFANQHKLHTPSFIVNFFLTEEEPEPEAELELEEDLPAALRTEFDELGMRYHQLQEDYSNMQQDYRNLQQECFMLRTENEKLRDELQKSNWSYSSVKCNTSKLVFFTGLTSVIFQWLLTKLSGSVECFRQNIPLEDHLLMVLMKIRLGLTNADLSYRFKVPTSTVSSIYRSWIPAMAKTLKPLIKWPNKEAILKHMPKCFKRKFRRCRCIIDCTEIFIARPSNLTSRAQTWSNYKHHNTIKYLISITPAGAISFMSPGWGGRVSDKQITRESGFLDLLEPMDEVLADRGFLIRDELAAYGATLRIPSFTKGKTQLSAQDVDTSRQLSRVRIHVERVIGRWKIFKILQTVIPLSQVDLLDDVVTVCAALTNLCRSVVPKNSVSN